MTKARSSEHALQCPRLIEVALPIREISAESVRDKSLRHGHISTLHLWWARRPLAAARAVVFGSLVPDPDHPACPKQFRDAVELHLKRKVPAELKQYHRGRDAVPDPDPYAPYEGVPDTLRNRLLTFIAKWSPEALEFERGRRTKLPKPEQLLDSRSLVKWETADPDNKQGEAVLHLARSLIEAAHGGKRPIVLDMYAGGGAIPLEAGRLGCQPIANDYNPVAYLILRSTCEFPQRYGRAGKRQVIHEEFGKPVEREVTVPDVLSHDVERWAQWILSRTRARIGELYPTGRDGLAVVGYIWVRTAPCSNPSCKARFPLIRSLLVCDKKDKQVALKLHIDKEQKSFGFGIAAGGAIGKTEGTMTGRGNARCPFCNQAVSVKDLKQASLDGRFGEEIAAVILDAPGGKKYRAVEASDLEAFARAKKMAETVEIPSEPMPVEYTQAFPSCTWGFTKWGMLFNPRQLVAMQTFVEVMREAIEAMAEESIDGEYRNAVAVYLGLWISRIAQRSSNLGIWDTTRETLQHPFGRQAIPMTWDYPEANPFSEATGGAKGGLDWMMRVISHESGGGVPATVYHGDASALPVDVKNVDAVVTDPPYFDAISYADVSDYFYVWLKRALAGVLDGTLATPLTPKSEEATALKHRHGGSLELADKHFVAKLAEGLSEAHRVLAPDGLVSVMFAHQSSKAWAALIRAVFQADLTVNGTWPIDTELTTALKGWKSALSSSITVACRPRVVGSAVSLRDVRRHIEIEVKEAVARFWTYGLRGADLIVACYGPAVGVFGQYERVEKADGTLVQVSDLLEIAQRAARDAIAGEFQGDNISTLYYVWANLYGASDQAWDDARLLVQVGGDTDNALEVARRHGIFVPDGASVRLAMLADRAARRSLGMDPNPPLIDALHRSMSLWKGEKRKELVAYLKDRGFLDDGVPFWKLAQALFEVLPRESDDWRLVNALLSERRTLKTEAKRSRAAEAQATLFGEGRRS